MKITYIVGNGFDLGLGLKTSYNDFIEDYLSIPIGRVEFVSFAKARLRDVIVKDVSTWADAELAFAGLDFSSMFSNSDKLESDFLSLLFSFRDDLAAYLKKQQSRFFPKGNVDQLSAVFKHRIVKSLYDGVVHCSDIVVQRKLKDKNERSVVNVINLNYTSTFDWLFYGGAGDAIEIPFVCYLEDRAPFELNVGNVHHVHGSLGGGNTLFGVSSASQIKDNSVRALSEYSGALVKSRMDRETNGDRYSAALKDLENSDVVALFGASFGASDKLWWRKIAELLVTKEHFRVCIFPHADVIVRSETELDRALMRFEWRKRLLSSIQGDLSAEEYSRLQDNMHKIIVLPFGPYESHDEKAQYNDPFDLTYFGSQVI